VPARFTRKYLSTRYDVSIIREDDWHTYSAERTADSLRIHLAEVNTPSYWLLNAGAGVYEVKLAKWRELFLDLFAAPIQNRHPYAICGSVADLPIKSSTCGAVVCVGEVLAYCDPSTAIAEFARVLVPSGTLVCDFGNSRSFRYWFTHAYGRFADLVTDDYNGSPERIWVYDPDYITQLLVTQGFRIKAKVGIHTWSALARRCGLSMKAATNFQRKLEKIQFSRRWADIMMIVAERDGNEK
jgi:SAM-dependent methyltransferase